MACSQARPTPTSSLKPATTSTPRVESHVAATFPSASSVLYVSYCHAGEKLNLYWTRMRNEWEPASATPYNETAEWIGELWSSGVNYWMVELKLSKSRGHLERLDDPLLACVFETLDNDDDGKSFRIPRPGSNLIKLYRSRSAGSVHLEGPPPSQSTRKATKVYGRRTKEQASLHPSGNDGYDDEEDEEDEEEHREGNEDSDDAGDEVDGGGEDDVGHVVDDEITSCDSDNSSLSKRPASRSNNPTPTQRKILGKGPGMKTKQKSTLAAPRAKKHRIETQRSGPGATLPPPFDHDDILITCKRYFVFKINWENKDYKYLVATLASGRGLEIFREMSPADRKQANSSLYSARKDQLHRVIRSKRSSILLATLTAVALYTKAWLRSEAGKTFLNQTPTRPPVAHGKRDSGRRKEKGRTDEAQANERRRFTEFPRPIN